MGRFTEVSALMRCLLAALLVAANVPAMAEEGGPPEIEYVVPQQSVWTTRLNAQGEPDNPLLPLAESLFARAGLRWHVRTYPAARMFRALEDGSSQFSMLVRSPMLEGCCLLSRRPVASADIRVYFLNGTSPLRSREELKGREVITVHGYSYGGLLAYLNDKQNHIGNNVAQSHEAAFTMLTHGRGAYLIDYAGPAGEVVAAQPVPGLRSTLLSRQEVFMVLSRRFPEAEKVMARLERIAESVMNEKNRKK